MKIADTTNTEGEPSTNTKNQSVATAVKNLFGNSLLSDVEIEGTDGTRIPAHRNILASQSHVFMQLLAGEFSEAKSSIVSLGFGGCVLRAVLEYCYTDEVVSFIENDGTGEDCKESMVRMAMDLASAADYFGLPKLCDKVVAWTTAQVKTNPSLALFLLIEAESSSQADIWSALAYQTIATHLEACLSLGEDWLSLVNLQAIERIVSDENTLVKESSLFSLVASWAGTDCSEKRKADAADLVARHIRLDNMTASELATLVKPSELMTKSQLCDAYERLATRAEHVHGTMSRMRRLVGRLRKASPIIQRGICIDVNFSIVIQCNLVSTGGPLR